MPHLESLGCPAGAFLVVWGSPWFSGEAPSREPYPCPSQPLSGIETKHRDSRLPPKKQLKFEPVEKIASHHLRDRGDMVVAGSPTECETYIPTGTIWPSGDFSYGFRRIDWAGPGRADRRNEAQRIDDGVYAGQWSTEYLRWQDEQGQRPGRVVEALEAEAFWESGLGESEGPIGPLNLTNARNSHRVAKRPESYGRKGITGYGKNMVKSAATLIQKMPNKRTTFATVTMPTLPAHLRRELALCWPEFVRQALQWLSRKLKRVGLPGLVVSCTEIQPKRLKGFGEAYLHLHLVWPNHWARAGNWAIDVLEFRAWCESFLIRQGIWVDGAWVNVNTQQVEKSAAGYLAKYMSKGVGEIQKMAEDCGWDAIPAQWWNMTAPLRALVKKYTRKGEAVGRILDAVVEFVLNTGDMAGVEALAECVMEYEGRLLSVGWRGRLAAWYRKDLLKMIDSQSAS